jgi:enamine deaminase RidA (YjgF/YER057c/UK114 family)
MAIPEATLQEMGIELPEWKSGHPAMAAGVITGNLLYLSGSTPKSAELRGRVGDALTVEQGYQAARECAINQLVQAKSVLGDLSRITRVVKLLGMVNAAPGFGDTPAVIHGASEFYLEVFGDKGVHARSAVGLQALPNEVAVEIETIFEIS